MKRVAIKKDQAFSSTGVPLCDNYHFSIHPLAIKDELDEFVYTKLGYEIVEVEDEKFEELRRGFTDMIKFQLEVSRLFKR